MNISVRCEYTLTTATDIVPVGKKTWQNRKREKIIKSKKTACMPYYVDETWKGYCNTFY